MTLIAALLIAFLFGWKLALLLVIAVPFIAGASYQQMMILRRNQRRDAELMNDAARVSTVQYCIQKGIVLYSKYNVF